MFKQLKKHPIYFSLIGASLCLGLLISFCYSKSAGFLLLNGFHCSFFDWFLGCCTLLGDGLFTLSIVVVLFAFKKYRKASTLLMAFLSSGLLVQLLKRLLHQPRPKLYFENLSLSYPHFVEGISLQGSNSFPSGHTATAFALATVLVLVFRKKKIALPCFLFALLVAYSRIYLSQHFLIDTVMGASIGTMAGMFSYYMVKQQKMPLPFKSMFKKAKAGRILSKHYGFSAKTQPVIQKENPTAP